MPKLKKNECKSSRVQLDLNERFGKPEVQEELTKVWSENTYVEGENFRMIQEPFQCCVLQNFVKSEDFIEDLKGELFSGDVEFHQKDNDLYQFIQSNDLGTIHQSPILRAFQDLMKNFARPLIQKITGFELGGTIDMFCAQYRYTDYLLCHDDQLEGRKIAYIWYLVDKDWNEEDGGTLDLFDRDEREEPRKVAVSMIPKWNQFVFFEVSPKSFHQVSQILSETKTRFSIGGWFHGHTDPVPPKSILSVSDKREVSEKAPYKKFSNWVNDHYQDGETIGVIRETFKENSETGLFDFFNQDIYGKICESFENSENLKWKFVGPANQRRYQVLETENQTGILKDLKNFFQNCETFRLLGNLTGLKLSEFSEFSESEDDEEQEASSSTSFRNEIGEPNCKISIRKWTQGCYTLIRDSDEDQGEFGLDVHLFFKFDECWNQEAGGFISYIAKNEDEELMNISPKDNSLYLVYRDKETLKFVKNINAKFKNLPFYEVGCVYYEK